MKTDLLALALMALASAVACGTTRGRTGWTPYVVAGSQFASAFMIGYFLCANVCWLGGYGGWTDFVELGILLTASVTCTVTVLSLLPGDDASRVLLFVRMGASALMAGLFLVRIVAG